MNTQVVVREVVLHVIVASILSSSIIIHKHF